MIAYLLASLPTPQRDAAPDLSPADFLARCRGFVGEDRERDLAWVLQGDTTAVDAAVAGTADAPSTREPYAARDATTRHWANLAELLDEAVIRARAGRARRDPAPDLGQPFGFRVDVAEAVAEAFAAADPGGRERALDDLRWRLADELAVAESDGFGALLARAVQLRLARRRAAFDREQGRAALDAALRGIEEQHG